MGKLDLNVETYRILAETLIQLRTTTRALLKACYGDDWEARGVPDLLRGFLDQRRMRESSIQWRLLETVDLLDFAGFENIAEVVSANPQVLAAFAPVSPDAELLRARFIELDAVQSRVAFARPVAESEMEFAVSFSERLRRVPTTLAPDAKMAASGPEAAARTEARPRAPRAETAGATARQPQPAAARAPASRSGDAPSHSGDAAPSAQRSAPPAQAGAGPAVGKAISATELARALDDGNVALCLTALYNEVTRLAELLWEEGIAGQAPHWEIVRESRWHHENFSRLGLKALSDFYDILGDVGRQTSAGASRTQIQEMLQERRFGEVLLALRELFRRHLVDQSKPSSAVS